VPLGDTDRFGEPISSEPHRFQEIFHQNFTGMDWGHISFHSFSPSVVVSNGNVIGVPIFPVGADSPLVINSDTPLTFPLHPSFSSHFQEGFGGIPGLPLHEFASVCEGKPVEYSRQPGRKRTLENLRVIFGAKRLNHGTILINGVSIVKH